LLCSDKKTIALYNPCTREYKILPSTLFELRIPSGKEYDKFCWERTLYGFGYDPINEDYKVVKIVDYYGNTIDRCFFSEVKVYSLMKSNSWKRIKGYPNYYAIFQPEYHRANKGEYIYIWCVF
jgi:F-box interacting protein